MHLHQLLHPAASLSPTFLAHHLSLSLFLSLSLSHLTFLHSIFFTSLSFAYLSCIRPFYLSLFMYSFTIWICRISFALAIFFLLGIASVYRERSASSRQAVGNCYVVSRGLTAIATALAVISVLLGIVYYHMVERLKKEMTIQGGLYTQEIPIVQPQLPAEPCFVHEDTYNRHQMPWFLLCLSPCITFVLVYQKFRRSNCENTLIRHEWSSIVYKYAP